LVAFLSVILHALHCPCPPQSSLTIQMALEAKIFFRDERTASLCSVFLLGSLRPRVLKMNLPLSFLMTYNVFSPVHSFTTALHGFSLRLLLPFFYVYLYIPASCLFFRSSLYLCASFFLKLIYPLHSVCLRDPLLTSLMCSLYIYSHVSSFLFVNSFFPHHCFAVRNVSFFPCTQSCCGFRLGTSGLERTGTMAATSSLSRLIHISARSKTPWGLQCRLPAFDVHSAFLPCLHFLIHLSF